MTWVIGKLAEGKKSLALISDIRVSFLGIKRPPIDCLEKQYFVGDESQSVVVGFAGFVHAALNILIDLDHFIRKEYPNTVPPLKELIERWWEISRVNYYGKSEVELLIGGVEEVGSVPKYGLAKIDFMNATAPITYARLGEFLHIGSGSGSEACQDVFARYCGSNPEAERITRGDPYMLAVDLSRSLGRQGIGEPGISSHLHVSFISPKERWKKNSDRDDVDLSKTPWSPGLVEVRMPEVAGSRKDFDRIIGDASAAAVAVAHGSSPSR